MKRSKWSGYDRYLVLSDESGHKLKSKYESYLNFKIVMEAVNAIAFTDKSTYSMNGNIYERKITKTEAQNILNDVENIKWSNKLNGLFLVANQLKLRM